MECEQNNSRRLGRWYLVLVILIAVLIVGGLISFHRWKHPKVKLTFVSGQEGGTYLELAKEFEALIESHLPNMEVEVLESAGSAENVEWIDSGKAQLALIQNDTPGSSKVRTIAPIHRGYLHFITRKNSPVSGIRDLRGKNLATGLPNSGSNRIVHSVLNYFGLEEKVNVSHLSVEDGIQALKSGDVDALMLMLGFRSAALLELFASSTEYELVSLPSTEIEALNGFVLTYPICDVNHIPPFSYGDEPAASVNTLVIRSLLVSGEQVPNRVVREITEVLFSNRSELIHRYAATSQMTESFSEDRLSYTVHLGARSYFSRSEPGFLIRYAEAMAFVLSVLLAGYGLFTAIRGWVHQKQKDRIDEYYLQVEGILRKLDDGEEPPSQEELLDLRAAVIETRHTALENLAAEKLIPDASFRILQHMLDQCQSRIRMMIE